MLQAMQRPIDMSSELLIESIDSSSIGSDLDKPSLLMCQPKLYEVSYVINPWMKGNLGNSSRRRAVQQWGELYGVLSGLADIHLVEPMAGSPDMVFTANAGLAREGVVAISSFYH